MLGPDEAEIAEAGRRIAEEERRIADDAVFGGRQAAEDRVREMEAEVARLRAFPNQGG